LAGIAYPTFAATVVSILAFALFSRRVVPEFRVRFGAANMATLKMLLIYGGFTTIIVIADILRLKIDSIVIGRMIGMAEVGIYGVAALLIQYMLKLVTSGMSVLSPRFAALDGADDRQKLKDIFLRSLSISSFIACGVGLIALLFGRSFLYLWVGKEFEAAVPVLSILAISYMFALSQAPGIGLMYALNKHRYYAAATMAEAIANVLLSILLAPRYGIIGVAIGTAIPMMLVKFFLQPIYVSRIANISLRSYTKAIAPAFLTSLLVIILFVSSVYLLDLDLEIRSCSLLIIGVVAVSFFYLLVNCCLSDSIRSLWVSCVSRFSFK
jgi:O-antigen/teichoic acid export membrane protein